MGCPNVSNNFLVININVCDTFQSIINCRTYADRRLQHWVSCLHVEIHIERQAEIVAENNVSKITCNLDLSI